MSATARFIESTPDILTTIRAERARRSLAYFVQAGWNVIDEAPLMWNWHMQAICDHLQWVLEDWMAVQRNPAHVQRARNILFNVPPGSGKSRLLSVLAPAWMWLHWPSWSVLCLSVNPEVARRDARLSRDVINSSWYQQWFKPRWRLKDDQDAAGDFANTARGSRQSKGITARVVGQRNSAIFVDDPNDMRDVNNASHRDDINNRWDDSLSNRLNDMRTGVTVGMMQRGHVVDWSGHWTRQAKVELVAIPMEFDPSMARTTVYGWRDPRTVEGEVMHPARFTPEVLAAERAKGSYRYAGQYQQRPVPATGGMFKPAWFNRYDELPRARGGALDLEMVSMTVDAAFKKNEGQTGSHVSVQVWGQRKAERWLLDVDTGPKDITETKASMRKMRERWPQILRVYIELKANGQAVVDELKTEWSDIVGINPGSDSKEGRAMSVQPIAEAGSIWIPRFHPGIDAWLHEFATFPNGQRDDAVDAAVQYLIETRTAGDLWAL